MGAKSQTWRGGLVLLAVLCTLPCLAEGCAVVWGYAHGYSAKALRDGLDFWAGGHLAWHGMAGLAFAPADYRRFLAVNFGPGLPPHLWSYPPNDLLLAAGFGWLAPWHAVLAFDLFGLLLLGFVLRLAGKSWWLVAAVLASPASLENLLEGQNAAWLTALIGGILLLPRRPALAGVLVGLASIKPQLGVVLPLFLLRRSRLAFCCAGLAALLLGGASVLAFGPGVWLVFWQVTRPAMNAVLLTGQPAAFAGGLISVFASLRPLGVHAALLLQGFATLAAMAWAARAPTKPPVVLVLAALASPYLHDYDLLGVTLAVALLVQDRLANGLRPGEAMLFFVAWFGPGALPWAPQFAHLVPAVLLLLAIVAARGDVAPCDSRSGGPASSAGPLPIPAPLPCTARGWRGTT